MYMYELSFKYIVQLISNAEYVHVSSALICASHFQMLQENKKIVLVLEDDVKFSHHFNRGLYNILKEANKFTPSWDLM